MSSPPEISDRKPSEISELTNQEMSGMISRSIAAKQRRSTILALAIGLPAMAVFLVAWDRGVIVLLAEKMWQILCRLAADWNAFLQDALR